MDYLGALLEGTRSPEEEAVFHVGLRVFRVFRLGRV